MRSFASCESLSEARRTGSVMTTDPFVLGIDLQIVPLVFEPS